MHEFAFLFAEYESTPLARFYQVHRVLQVTPCPADRVGRYTAGPPGNDDLAPRISCAGAYVDHPVALRDCAHIMFDDHDRVAGIDQAV